VADEFVGEDGRVYFYFDEIDGHGGDFGEDYASDGVGETEVYIFEDEVHPPLVGLAMVRLFSLLRNDGLEHLSDSDGWATIARVHFVVHGRVRRLEE
jgi:hypothetical protein